MTLRVPVATAAAVAALILAGVGLRSSAETIRRPSGAAERFLHAVSIEDHDGVARWGEPDKASRLTEFDPDDDTLFATIEVGRSTGDGSGTAVVPARIVRNDASDTTVSLHLTAVRTGADPGAWRIVDVAVVEAAAVPSTGGDRPARATSGAWLLVAALAVAGALASDLLVSRLRANGQARVVP